MQLFDFKFYHWEKVLADQPFLRQPFGGRWEVYTWAEAGQLARKLAAGLQSLGLPPKSHIGLISKNCREWVIADLAIIMAGYVSVPLYPTLTAEALEEVLNLGDVAALFVGKLDNWDKMKAGIPNNLPLMAFPSYEGHADITEATPWEEMVTPFLPIKGTPSPALEDLWTIVFTSGTTGTPKGVMLTFEILNNTTLATKDHNILQTDFNGNNHFFSYLALNHIAERTLIEMTCLAYGGSISFAEHLKTFNKNLKDTRPTMFFGVPRIWTKFQLNILANVSQETLDQALQHPDTSDNIKKQLVASLGLDRARATLTGAAPISNALKLWYRSIGIRISEGYGMTENCAIATMLAGDEDILGTVGKSQPHVQIRIDEATGEILNKSPYVMKGYYNDPEKTAEVLRDGWLHTGDQGYLDENGYLFITGRVKDAFKTSKGKFIVPAPLEWEFESNVDMEQICVMGLGCPQPIVLVVLSEMGAAKSRTDLTESLTKHLNAVNTDKPNYTKISTVVVIHDAWSVDNGSLTPTLKVKRNVLHQRYKDMFMNWHEADEVVVFTSLK